MKCRYLVATSVAGLSIAALGVSPAAAQSTGSLEFEGNEIVVTGVITKDVGGVEIPETPKAKQVLDEEIIRRQRPGQTINDIINLVPGVSFQNNDPWGSGGGSFTVRGFGADRVSQTVDGIPLNDSGNYALYTNQQIDSEILESVNVNLGVTDVDSPTASATGGTINIRTRTPSRDFGLTATGSYGNILASESGNRPYYRIFGMVDTGDFTGSGTMAFLSASYATYDNPFNNYSEVEKQQYNGKIYQELGDNGDFISVAGHYNQNRNNFFGSMDFGVLQDMIEDGDKDGRFYDINYPCTIPSGQLGGEFAEGPDGIPDGPDGGDVEQYNDSTGCGAEFDRRYNPSNTGNIRGSSRFSFGDDIVLTVDPSYQYVKANGGGPEDLREGFANRGGVDYTGFIGGGYYFGMDLNGDGDLNDRVAGIDPSQTRTHRYGVIASLAYQVSDQHRVRVAYTWDRAEHRQTGQTAFMLPDGEPTDVFPVNHPLKTSYGFELNKRDRQSYAILHQISGEYRGNYLDDDLTVVLGLRAPFFTRDLDQRCYTTTASGFIDCIGDQDPTAYEAANPNAAPPQKRTYKYDKILPTAGFTYNLTPEASTFANYSKGLSVPGTDPLYDSFFIPNVEEARPVPETTDSFDLGLRFQSGNIQAQVAGWYTEYNNRLATAYDPILDEVLYRNLGRVDKYGLDASVAWMPTPESLIYVFGSLNESEIKDDIADGNCVATDIGAPGIICEGGIGGPKFLATAGNRESGAPDFTIGARGQIRVGMFELGAQVKHTGERYANDLNLAKTGTYTLVDLDLRVNLAENPAGDGNIALQFNVTNLFDDFYIGGFGGSLDGSPFVQIGPPRAASVSLIFGY